MARQRQETKRQREENRSRTLHDILADLRGKRHCILASELMDALGDPAPSENPAALDAILGEVQRRGFAWARRNDDDSVDAVIYEECRAPSRITKQARSAAEAREPGGPSDGILPPGLRGLRSPDPSTVVPNNQRLVEWTARNILVRKARAALPPRAAAEAIDVNSPKARKLVRLAASIKSPSQPAARVVPPPSPGAGRSPARCTRRSVVLQGSPGPQSPRNRLK